MGPGSADPRTYKIIGSYDLTTPHNGGLTASSSALLDVSGLNRAGIHCVEVGAAAPLSDAVYYTDI